MRTGSGLFRRVRRLSRLTIAAGVVALVACVGVVAALAFHGGGSAAKGSDQAIAAPTKTPSPTPVPDIERLIIPSIKLDAQVTPKTVDASGEMPSPQTPEEVIWYDFAALPGLGGRPGLGGNTVLAGHVDYYGYGPAVFSDLHDVKLGDEITVRLRDGREYEYVAQSNRIVDPAVASFTEIVATTPEESLTVITCAGDFDPATHSYDMRRVIWAVRVG